MDDFGFSSGNEGEINKKLSNLKCEKNKIIIDEDIKDIFGYYNSYKNNTHLLLYFFSYQGPYNII